MVDGLCLLALQLSRAILRFWRAQRAFRQKETRPCSCYTPQLVKKELMKPGTDSRDGTKNGIVRFDHELFALSRLSVYQCVSEYDKNRSWLFEN